MHAGENFAKVKGDIAQLLRLYRSASLRVLDGIMRRPELERIADARTKKNVRPGELGCFLAFPQKSHRDNDAKSPDRELLRIGPRGNQRMLMYRSNSP